MGRERFLGCGSGLGVHGRRAHGQRGQAQRQRL
jgi:hypothetical protein